MTVLTDTACVERLFPKDALILRHVEDLLIPRIMRGAVASYLQACSLEELEALQDRPGKIKKNVIKNTVGERGRVLRDLIDADSIEGEKVTEVDRALFVGASSFVFDAHQTVIKSRRFALKHGSKTIRELIAQTEESPEILKTARFKSALLAKLADAHPHEPIIKEINDNRSYSKVDKLAALERAAVMADRDLTTATAKFVSLGLKKAVPAPSDSFTR